MAEAPDPRRLAAERRAELARNLRYRITVDGTEYVFRLGDVTARQVRALREEAGMQVPELVRQVVIEEATWDIDCTAGMIWLARLQAGETVPFAAVLDALRLDQVLVVAEDYDPEPSEDYPDPPR